MPIIGAVFLEKLTLGQCEFFEKATAQSLSESGCGGIVSALGGRYLRQIAGNQF